MQGEIFKAYNEILFMVVAQGRALGDFTNGSIVFIEKISKEYEKSVNAAKKQGADFIKELEQKMRAKWGWFAYMPPEARGAMLASIGM